MKDVLVIIPSYKPPKEFNPFIERLKSRGFHKILIVNDGSPASFNKAFQAAAASGAQVLTSEKNCGKGHAIKLGIQYALATYPEEKYFVFCDDDGQHADGDVARVATKAIQESKLFVLGQRSFPANTPWKSLLGNSITSRILKLRFGLDTPDSQTGLRCISRSIAPKLLEIQEDRFGFELKTLLLIHRTHIEISTVPIATIYFYGNSRTRFHPIKDSFSVLQIALGFKR